MDKTNIIFIGGAGRSGTTVFGKCIANSLAAMNVGELKYGHSWGVVENRICGCQKKFLDCQLWREIISENKKIEYHLEILEKNTRWRYLHHSLLSLCGLKTQRSKQTIEAYEFIYTQISNIAKKKNIVDSSKEFPYFLALMTTRLEVKSIIVVKNIKQVVASTQRNKIVLETGQPERIHKKSAYFYFIEWIVIYLFYFMSKLFYRNSMTIIGYHEFIVDPAKILNKLGAEKPFDYRKGVYVEQMHEIGGNPGKANRFVKLQIKNET